jgi:hypothetical protein
MAAPLASDKTAISQFDTTHAVFFHILSWTITEDEDAQWKTCSDRVLKSTVTERSLEHASVEVLKSE